MEVKCNLKNVMLHTNFKNITVNNRKQLYFLQ